MGKTDPRVDVYIDKAAPYAVPILGHLREPVHEACPDVAEAIKWGVPSFDYKGKILCQVAAFKQHLGFGFWLGAHMNDPEKILTPVGGNTAMGSLGKVRTLADLPADDVLIRYIRHAMELIDSGVKFTREKPVTEQKPLVIPDDFLDLLQTGENAFDNFQKMSYSHKKEYLDWFADAKSEPTRLRRQEKALAQLEEGKSMHWKYEKR